MRIELAITIGRYPADFRQSDLVQALECLERGAAGADKRGYKSLAATRRLLARKVAEALAKRSRVPAPYAATAEAPESRGSLLDRTV